MSTNAGSYFLPNHTIPKGSFGGDKVSNQTNGKQRINVEHLVNFMADTSQVLISLCEQYELEPCWIHQQLEAPSLLAFIRALDPTLLKKLYVSTKAPGGQPWFVLFARFGLPGSDEELITLSAEVKE